MSRGMVCSLWGKKIILTNYEKLHLFDPKDFAGVVCDESGILKNYDGTLARADNGVHEET